MIMTERDCMNSVYTVENLRNLFGDDLVWILQLCEEHSITIHGLGDTEGLSNENVMEFFDMLLRQLTDGPLLLEF